MWIIIYIFSEALRGMEAVAEHINEMQKIYEEYGNIFDDLLKAYKEAEPKAKVRSIYFCPAAMFSWGGGGCTQNSNLE